MKKLSILAMGLLFVLTTAVVFPAVVPYSMAKIVTNGK